MNDYIPIPSAWKLKPGIQQSALPEEVMVVECRSPGVVGVHSEELDDAILSVENEFLLTNYNRA